MSHDAGFHIQLGDRGRLVLPAAIRRRLKLQQGDELLLTVQEDGTLRVSSARQIVRETRGLYRNRARNRSLVDELIADRRAEAVREKSRG